MYVELLRRGKIRPESREAIAESRPINDLLGLRVDEAYLAWFEDYWGDAVPRDDLLQWARRTSTEQEGFETERPDSRIDWLREVSAAQTPTRGVPYGQLAPLLEQVEYHPGAIEVPGLHVLAAWSLKQTIERGIDHVMVCDNCRRLWFGRAKPSRYCYRPAPGQSITCAQLAAVRRFDEERSEWNREYRKVYARLLRARKSSDPDRAWKAEAEFRQWKRFNRAGKRGVDWIEFDVWKHDPDSWSRKQEQRERERRAELAAFREDLASELVDEALSEQEPPEQKEKNDG